MSQFWGQLALFLLGILAVIFLTGASVASFCAWFFWLRKSKFDWGNKALKLCLIGIIGGVLSVGLLFLWERYEENRFSHKVREFSLEMTGDYRLTKVEVKDNRLTVKYLVPRTAEYAVHLFGSTSVDMDKNYPFELGKSVIKVDRYQTFLSEGENELSVDLKSSAIPENARTLDLVLAIIPVHPIKFLVYDRKGFFASHMGGEVYNTEGISYYSDHTFYCYQSIRGQLPCVSSPDLHIPLKQSD